MSKRMPKVDGVYLQAESEVAAINMVLGASAAGKRVLTSSSSPGISLKTEGISYIAGSDLPCVIINIQRGGPGLGGIQPSQADYYQATKAPGHGDFKMLVYAPSTVQEMIDCMQTAFDKSDQYRMPAMILADGVLGQMMEPVEMGEGNQTDLPEKTWATNGHRGKRAQNVVNSLYLNPALLEETVKMRYLRYELIKVKEQRAECEMIEDAEIVVVAYGATGRIVKSAVKSAREEGIKVGLIRPITLWPFPVDVIRASLQTAKKFLCVEMSMGQMVDDVRLAVNGRCPVAFFGRTGGIIPTPTEVLEKIREMGKMI